MENKQNVSYLILEGYVDMNKYRYLYFVIMFTAYVLILCSNSTIVWLIVVHRSLHEPMYMFIAGLLTNSVLFSTLIYPKILIDILSEKPTMLYSVCLFQWFAYYSLAGAEFFLLAAMAYDRYVSICKPLQYATIMRKKNVNILLVLAWLLPTCQVGVPISMNANKKLCKFTFKGILCNSTVYKLHCVSSTFLNIYGLIAFVNIILLPLLFILFTYIRIFIITYRSCREVRRKAAQTCLPHLIVLLNFSCLSAYDVLLLRLEVDFPTIVRFIMTLQIILYHPLFNPVIYGLKMKAIYQHLRKLFFPGTMV
ncbi:olfactory receptor 10K1-like [Mugil cephalus]|uniref:olfactory receptor 10K1-like n=1 Tax=Mugil cephalus TaxID=48193 RepID=UPI001FB73065|nr:olfactory receptor 10K1-like [Mugil cephalus]